MQPVIVSLPAFHVVGLEGTFAPEAMSQIPDLWGRFLPRKAGIPGRKGDVTFGFSRPHVPGPHGTKVFVYTAAVEVVDLSAVPEGLVGFTVPGATYARFTHTGPFAGIGRTIDAMWTQWIPASGLVPTQGLEFERYDDRWDAGTASGPVDLYVPVDADRGTAARGAGPLASTAWRPPPAPPPTSASKDARVTLEAAPEGVVPLCPHCRASLDTIWSLVEGFGWFGQERILLCPSCRSFLGYNAWQR